MSIIVDADACPVKQIIIEEAKRVNEQVVMVSSIAHELHFEKDDVELITVDNVSQAADLAIINHVKANDIVVTNDYGLASIVLQKKAFALNFTGKQYTADNIDELLFRRHLSAKQRKAGHRVKGPKKMQSEHKEAFRHSLILLLSKK